MQAFDFAPFARSSIGFGRLFELLEGSSRGNPRRPIRLTTSRS
jgi:hypothetical protein